MNKKGLLLYKDRLDVPNVPKIKLLILNEIHKNPYSGHPGYQKTIRMLRKDYFWANMKMNWQNILLYALNVSK